MTRTPLRGQNQQQQWQQQHHKQQQQQQQQQQLGDSGAVHHVHQGAGLGRGLPADPAAVARLGAGGAGGAGAGAGGAAGGGRSSIRGSNANNGVAVHRDHHHATRPGREGGQRLGGGGGGGVGSAGPGAAGGARHGHAHGDPSPRHDEDPEGAEAILQPPGWLSPMLRDKDRGFNDEGVTGGHHHSQVVEYDIGSVVALLCAIGGFIVIILLLFTPPTPTSGGTFQQDGTTAKGSRESARARKRASKRSIKKKQDDYVYESDYEPDGGAFDDDVDDFFDAYSENELMDHLTSDQYMYHDALLPTKDVTSPSSSALYYRQPRSGMRIQHDRNDFGGPSQPPHSSQHQHHPPHQPPQPPQPPQPEEHPVVHPSAIAPQGGTPRRGSPVTTTTTTPARRVSSPTPPSGHNRSPRLTKSRIVSARDVEMDASALQGFLAHDDLDCEIDDRAAEESPGVGGVGRRSPNLPSHIEAVGDEDDLAEGDGSDLDGFESTGSTGFESDSSTSRRSGGGRSSSSVVVRTASADEDAADADDGDGDEDSDADSLESGFGPSSASSRSGDEGRRQQRRRRPLTTATFGKGRGSRYSPPSSPLSSPAVSPKVDVGRPRVTLVGGTTSTRPNVASAAVLSPMASPVGPGGRIAIGGANAGATAGGVIPEEEQTPRVRNNNNQERRFIRVAPGGSPPGGGVTIASKSSSDAESFFTQPCPPAGQGFPQLPLFQPNEAMGGGAEADRPSATEGGGAAAAGPSSEVRRPLPRAGVGGGAVLPMIPMFDGNKAGVGAVAGSASPVAPTPTGGPAATTPARTAPPPLPLDPTSPGAGAVASAFDLNAAAAAAADAALQLRGHHQQQHQGPMDAFPISPPPPPAEAAAAGFTSPTQPTPGRFPPLPLPLADGGAAGGDVRPSGTTAIAGSSLPRPAGVGGGGGGPRQKQQLRWTAPRQSASAAAAAAGGPVETEQRQQRMRKDGVGGLAAPRPPQDRHQLPPTVAAAVATDRQHPRAPPPPPPREAALSPPPIRRSTSPATVKDDGGGDSVGAGRGAEVVGATPLARARATPSPRRSTGDGDGKNQTGIVHKRDDLPNEDSDASASLPLSIRFSELKMVEVIGGGGFGQVWHATWQGTPVAVKMLTHTALLLSKSRSAAAAATAGKSSDEGGDDDAGKEGGGGGSGDGDGSVPHSVLAEFAAEINLLSGMRHPNICLYLGACLEPPNWAIITELAAHGSLWDALRKPLAAPFEAVGVGDGPLSNARNMWPPALYHGDDDASRGPMSSFVPPSPPPGTWPWSLVKKVAHGAARGMTYLHGGSPPVLHRDLKSANLLLDESYTTKVADFGLSRIKAQERSMTGNCGTVQWMAPEVLANQRYAEPADVYSFGIILWELLTRECPYDGMGPIQCALAVLNNGERPEIPLWCPPSLAALIRTCVAHDPGSRPTFKQIVSALDAMP